MKNQLWIQKFNFWKAKLRNMKNFKKKKYEERQKTQEELTNQFRDEISKNVIIIDDLKRHITYNGTRLAECQKLQGELEKKNVLLEENIRKEISKFEKAQLRKQSYKEKMVLLERNLTRVSNEGGDSLTKEENKQLKKKITCNICDDQEKSVIITRCSHMFCRPCVQKRITDRSRKCPACGKPFSETDVKDIWF